MDTIKRSLTFSSHLNKYKWTQRGLILPVASFAADVHVSPVSESQIQTESKQRLCQEQRMRVFILRLLLRDSSPECCCLGSNGSDSTYFSSPIVIQNYCPRIKDRFGKNLPRLI